MKIRPLRLKYMRWSVGLLSILVSCSNPVDHELTYTWSPVKISSDLQEAEQMEMIIAPFRIRLDSIMNEVIGYAAHDLTSARAYESTLGTFVTELLLTQSIASYDRPVDVAIMNHKGGLRAPINEGPITLGEVFQVMPFENEMLLLEVPGDQLLKVVDFIGQSGRSMIWPVSFEVSDKIVTNVRLHGELIQPDRNYTLTISDYLANGGGGFELLKPLKRLEVVPVTLRDMIVQEIRQRTMQGDSIQVDLANLVTLSKP